MDYYKDSEVLNHRPYIDQSLISRPLVMRRGHPARISFKVFGHPPSKVTWFIGSEKHVPEEIGWSLKKDNDGRFSLTINSVTENFDGGITLAAVNMMGKTSCHIPVTTYKGMYELVLFDEIPLHHHHHLFSVHFLPRLINGMVGCFTTA